MAYAAGAAAAAIAQAVKASGAIVNMEPEEFMTIVDRCDRPVVVTARGGLLDRGFRYLVSYKGFVFHTRSKEALMLSGRVEIVQAKTIWIPG
ncbi:MAG: hypothetical protein JXA58_07690 [Dehalococcoidia bacterium]|nr:hypothetical protein [Dehalococcoidia bacterium]